MSIWEAEKVNDISGLWTYMSFGMSFGDGRIYPDSKVHGANMGPIWGRQDPGGPHVGPMNFAIWARFRELNHHWFRQWFVDKRRQAMIHNNVDFQEWDSMRIYAIEFKEMLVKSTFAVWLLMGSAGAPSTNIIIIVISSI